MHQSTIRVIAIVATGTALFILGGCQRWPMRNESPAAAPSAQVARSGETADAGEAASGQGPARQAAAAGTNPAAHSTAADAAEKPDAEAKSEVQRPAVIERGHGPLVRRVAQQAAVTPEGKITLNFEGTKLREVVKVILSDVLHENYTIDPSVTGTVSINTSRPLSKDALLPTLEVLLRDNGAALRKEGDLYHIVSLSSARKDTLPGGVINLPSRVGPGYRTVVVPLRYLAVTQAEKLLKPFISDNVMVHSDPVRNVMILSGSEQSLQGLLNTLDIFDVDWMKGMSLGLFPLANADAKTVVAELRTLFGKAENSPLNGVVRMVPIERLNAVLVVTPQPSYLDHLQQWITNLDQPGDQGVPSVHVYKVKNGKASDLADVLSSLFGGEKSKRKEQPPETAPGYSPLELQSMGGTPAPAGGAGSAQTGTGSQPSVTTRTHVSKPSITTTHAGDVTIVADDVHNAVVVWCTPKEYRTIENALRQLDVMPQEVLIEASIIEVTLTKDLQYGLEWFITTHTGAYNSETQLNLGAGGTKALDAIVPGFSYALVAPGGVRGVLNALASETKVHVLSSPSLMVLDNQTAKINVGDDVPIPVSQSTSNLVPSAPTVNAIEYRSTGVLLDVTPRIGEGGLVTMDISQEVSDVTRTTSSNLDAPTISKRAIQSTVAVQSGDTLVLGGLIKDNRSNNESGIPFLSKLPVIGKLFGQTANNLTRTELLVLITPRTVRDQEDSRKVTAEFRSKLRELESP